MMAFARWNLACCELLGWKETARHLNPMLSGSVMMFWERTCSKLPICLNFCGTAFLQQQPESYCEACLLTLYRVYSRASPCVAYGVWSLNLFIFPTSIFFKKKKKISAEQPCSSSSFAPYPHLISPPLVCSNRCRNKENLLLFFPSQRTNLGSVSSHLFQSPCWVAGLSAVPCSSDLGGLIPSCEAQPSQAGDALPWHMLSEQKRWSSG